MIAREWWIGPAKFEGRLIAYDSGMSRPCLGVKVREVLPDTVTITAKELLDVILVNIGNPAKAHDIVNSLFGGPQRTASTERGQE